MELQEAFYQRISVRKFTSEPVSKEILEKVLRLAGRAPSGMNTQPWAFFVVAGKPLDRLKADMIDHLRSGTPPAPEVMIPGWPSDSVFRKRQVTLGKQLFSLMEIPRDDPAARMAWMERGFRYFDAPAVIFLCYDNCFADPGPLMDIGAVMQSLCLAAVEYGLGTCIGAQGVQYPQLVREYAQVPETKKVAIAVAVGYPDPDFPANRVKSERAPVEEITTWVGWGS